MGNIRKGNKQGFGLTFVNFILYSWHWEINYSRSSKIISPLAVMLGCKMRDNNFNQSVLFAGFSRKLNIELGVRILKIGLRIKGREPSPKHNRCSSTLKGTALSKCPPNSTHEIWMAMMMTNIKTNRELLKKILKTLIWSDLSFFALMRLNTCNSTNVWKKMQ